MVFVENNAHAASSGTTGVCKYTASYELCFDGVPIAVLRHYDQKQVGKDRTYAMSLSQIIRKTRTRIRSKNLEAKLKQEPWRGAASWLTPHGLLGLLSSRTQGHSRGAALSAEILVLPHQPSIKEMHHRLTHRPI